MDLTDKTDGVRTQTHTQPRTKTDAQGNSIEQETQPDSQIKDTSTKQNHSDTLANAAETQSALRLWDYGLIYESNILNRIPFGQQQRRGIEMVTGEMPDISEWIDFKFYNRVWYYNQKKKIEIDGSGRQLA